MAQQYAAHLQLARSGQIEGDARSTRAQFIMDNFTWITYPMPPDVLRLGQNELKIDIKRLNPAICVTPRLDHVEILVQYA